MRELLILLAPVYWSVRNNIVRLRWAFYRKLFLYVSISAAFVFLFTFLLNTGMMRLQTLSPEVFTFLAEKGFSLIFIIIFLFQIINGFVISLNTFYQAKHLELLLVSPVDRLSLFIAQLVETHLKASWMLAIFGIPVLVSLGLVFKASILYYPYSLVLFFTFSIIPVNIGAGLAILLSRMFSAGKMKRLIISASVVALAILTILFRLFRPERFVNPELFANLTLFLSDLQTPSFILLPNRWLSDALFNFLSSEYTSILILVPLILLTAYLTVLPVFEVFKRFHYSGWSSLQESKIAFRKHHTGSRFYEHWFGGGFSLKSLSFFHSQSRALLVRDFLQQIRDSKVIQQIMILFSLMVVYLISISSLPLNWEDYAVRLKYTVSFFNLGLVLIILASLCARIVYPSVLSEAGSVWLLRTAPLTAVRYIWTRFFFFYLPICLFGLFLNAFSLHFINVEKNLLLLLVLTTACTGVSLVSMAFAFGISNLKSLIRDNPNQYKSGSTAYMLVSVFLILFTLAAEAIPVFLYFLKESRKVEFTGKAWGILGITVLVIIGLNLFISFLSIRKSIREFIFLQLD